MKPIRWPVAAVAFISILLCGCSDFDLRVPGELGYALAVAFLTGAHSVPSSEVKIVNGKPVKNPFAIEFSAPDAVASSPPSSPRVPSRAAASKTLVYASDVSNGAVEVIDPYAVTILSAIALPSGDTPQGIAATPDGRFVWVVDEGAAGSLQVNPSIQIIDSSTNRITGSIKLPGNVRPTWIAITPDGKTAYVTNEGEYLLGINNSAGALNSILVIDVATRTGTAEIAPPLRNPQLPNAGHAHFEHLAVSPDGALLYAAAPGLGYFVYDILTNAQIYPPPSYAFGVVNFFAPQVYPTFGTPVVFHPNGTRVYFYGVVCPQSTPGRTCLVELDTKTHTALRWVSLQPAASADTIRGLGIAPDGRTAWVKEFDSGDFIPVDTVTFTAQTHLAGPPSTQAVFCNLPVQ